MRNLTTLLVFLLPLLGIAQTHLGVKQSNYAGILGADLNPASIADNRYKFQMNLVGFNVGAYNSFLGVNANIFGLPDMLKDSNFLERHTVENELLETHSFFGHVELHGPSFMFSLNDRTAIGFSSKVNFMLNVDGVDRELAKLSKEGLEYADLWNLDITNDHLSAQTMAWAEYGVNFGQVVMDHEEHFVKVGGRAKFLQGLSAMYLFVDDFRYSFLNSDTMSIFSTDITYGHSTNFDGDPSDYFKYRMVSKPGFGFDLGVEYEWRPESKEYHYEMDGRPNLWMDYKNKYKVKAGFALTDVGGIRFDKGELSRDFHANIDDWKIDTLGINTVAKFDSVLVARFQQMPQDEGSFKMNLPTAFMMHVDYEILHGLYVNSMAYLAFQFKKDANKVHQITSFSISPRYEHRFFGVTLPVSYGKVPGFRAGLGLRLGPLLIGTSDFRGLVRKSNLRGGDMYFSTHIPLYFHKERDRDGDHVSDHEDDCPDVAGVWEFHGCPDTDKDHIRDTEDDCPAEAGVPEFKGCPDTDRDGVMDKEDACPTEAGSVALNGCPDKDGDGIPDYEDKCPLVAGDSIFFGCPDSDKDGIVDAEDNCPAEAGPKGNFGCPQLVKLHLVDQYGNIVESTVLEDDKFVFRELSLDKNYMFLLEGDEGELTQVSIVIRNNGEETVITANRNDETGFFEYRYLDGKEEKMELMEEVDEGVLLAKEEEEILNTAFSNLQFESGKAIISESSFESLSELVDLLLKKPDWKIKLEGHTDNVGKASSNLMLSKRRAEAVKFYLSNRGVEESRIIVRFYGQNKPIETNDTPDGREANRRVEMQIIQ